MSELELRRAMAERDVALAASREAEQRQALLVRELHHRIRNSLAMVQSLLGATARTTGSVAEFYRSFSARIGSLAKTQTLLTEDYWQTAPLRELVLKELRPFAGETQPRYTLTGPEVELSADLAVPVGMALHELTINAAKYGALSVPGGEVEVTWGLRTVDGVRKVHLEWQERGGPPSRAPEREGFGSTLLRKVLPMQTKADVAVEFNDDGLRCRIEVPLVEKRLVPEY
jgi:two-component sensor histidine kinase